MLRKLTDKFCWMDLAVQNEEEQVAAEKYKRIASWARRARGQNPNAFDALTEWVLDDSQWNDADLAENEQVLMLEVFTRFREQNQQLRAYLKELEPFGVVNPALFKALDRFDEEVSGRSADEQLRQVVASVFADFSVMREHKVRQLIAGTPTGQFGTLGVDLYGYINYLKDCDAAVQWALFMPDLVERQQTGFKVESFECKSMSAMRFIGRESEDLIDVETRKNYFRILDAMDEHKSGFGYDVLLMHHFGLSVDTGPRHGFWGRFMKAGAPVPEGFSSFDFVQYNDGRAGLPFVAQFAFATFSGDPDAMHRREGFDSDAMYDVTRNIMLGQGIHIPYPDKYWTAEVFLNGHTKHSTAYMFSAGLP